SLSLLVAPVTGEGLMLPRFTLPTHELPPRTPLGCRENDIRADFRLVFNPKVIVEKPGCRSRRWTPGRCTLWPYALSGCVLSGCVLGAALGTASSSRGGARTARRPPRQCAGAPSGSLHTALRLGGVLFGEQV